MKNRPTCDTGGTGLYWGRRLRFEKVGAEGSAELLVRFLEHCRNLVLQSRSRECRVAIVAGEATDEEYRVARNAFDALLNTDNVKVEIAAGPVLSGDKNKHSIILDLARDYPNRFLFYQLPTRSENHWKVLEIDGKPQLLQVEKAHEPVPKVDCLKATLNADRFFPLKGETSGRSQTNGMSLTTAFAPLAKQHLEWFDHYFKKEKFLYMPLSESQRKVPVLTTQQIRRTHQWILSRGGTYDSMNADEILEYARDAHAIKPEPVS